MIEVARPSEQEIKRILEVHIVGYKLEEGVSTQDFVNHFSSCFRGMTGAAIRRTVELAVQNSMNESGAKILSNVTLHISDVEKAIKENLS